MKRNALGKGLRSLIPEAPPRTTPPAREAGPKAPAPGESLQQVDIDRIRPNRYQPRQSFDEESLETLARSMKADGMLQPVILRPADDGRYEIIAGERRWRAAQRAGLLKIPAIIRQIPDARLLEFALIENLQREELNPIEEARAFQTLIQTLGLTQQEVAERVGKQRATVANTLRLLSLAEPVQALVRSGQLSMGHARALLALASSDEQARLAARTVKEGLSVRGVEALVAAAGRAGSSARPKAAPDKDPNVAAAEENLQRLLGTKVQIVRGKGGGGRIELHFYSDEELQRLYQLVSSSARRKG